MKYISTRGGAAPCSAALAIIKGLAPDGGLYVPEFIPTFSTEELDKLTSLDYRQTAVMILGKYLDFTEAELTEAVTAAYAGFDGIEPVAVRSLTEDLSVLELWHGPTSAFKDMALQLLPRLLTLSLQKEGISQTTHILTATSGDTGKAALEGFRDVPGTRITVFYPRDGVSQIQQAQMVTQQGDNVNVVAVNGNFDDAQSAVKRIFSNPRLSERLSAEGVFLSSANSINWGRLLPQIVYYVYCAVRLGSREPVNFVVPTGNFGDILAGWFAKAMGAPIDRLVCASNANRVLTDFFQTGTYDKRRLFCQTISPSMDILISSNLERLLYLCAGCEKTAAWMRQLAKEGYYTVDEDTLQLMNETLDAFCCDDAETSAVIAFCFQNYDYLMDPHTAVGMSAFFQAKSDLIPHLFGQTVLISTASPFKFPETVLKALGKEPDLPNGRRGLDSLDDLASLTHQPIPSGLDALRHLPVRFTEAKDPDDLEEVIISKHISPC